MVELGSRGLTVRQGGELVMPYGAGVVVIPADDVRPVLEEAARIEERGAETVARMRAEDLRPRGAG